MRTVVSTGLSSARTRKCLSVKSGRTDGLFSGRGYGTTWGTINVMQRSEEHTSELQSLRHLVCRLLLEKKNDNNLRPPIALAFPPPRRPCSTAQRIHEKRRKAQGKIQRRMLCSS